MCSTHLFTSWPIAASSGTWCLFTACTMKKPDGHLNHTPTKGLITKGSLGEVIRWSRSCNVAVYAKNSRRAQFKSGTKYSVICKLRKTSTALQMSLCLGPIKQRQTIGESLERMTRRKYTQSENCEGVEERSKRMMVVATSQCMDSHTR